MTGEFLNIAGALSEEEFAGLASALLARLESLDAPGERDTEAAESAPETAALIAAEETLAEAAEKLAAAAAAEKTEAAYYRLRSTEVSAEPSAADRTVSALPGRGGENGTFRRSVTDGGGHMDAEELSESIRRDARRFDSGFERY